MGLLIQTIGGNCPVQAEGTVDRQPFYFRARGDGWSMSIGGKDVVGSPSWYYEEGYGTWPDAGWMPLDEARAFIDQAVAKWRSERKRSPESRKSRLPA